MAICLLFAYYRPFGTQYNLSDNSLPTDMNISAVTNTHAFYSDDSKIDLNNKKKLIPLFEKMYVIKGIGTDCSFVASFMLMVRHDPDYPFKIMTANSDGSYTIRFPGYGKSITISPEDMRKYHSYLDKQKSFKSSVVSALKGSHTPAGIEILRCAYYRYQRETNQRPPGYAVYGGGWPIRDMLILSGAKKGGAIEAYGSYANISPSARTFYNSIERRMEHHLQNGIFKVLHAGEVPVELENPLLMLGKLSDYFIILCSAKKIGKISNFFSDRIIPNHAYYFLGINNDGRYILGDSYNTTKPIYINEDNFLKKFNAIHYVKISQFNFRD